MWKCDFYLHRKWHIKRAMEFLLLMSYSPCVKKNLKASPSRMSSSFLLHFCLQDKVNTKFLSQCCQAGISTCTVKLIQNKTNDCTFISDINDSQLQEQLVLLYLPGNKSLIRILQLWSTGISFLSFKQILFAQVLLVNAWSNLTSIRHRGNYVVLSDQISHK